MATLDTYISDTDDINVYRSLLFHSETGDQGVETVITGDIKRAVETISTVTQVKPVGADCEVQATTDSTDQEAQVIPGIYIEGIQRAGW